MNTVDAVNKDQIALVRVLMEKRYPRIYSDVWKIGLNMSLRISDLLTIKYKDLDIPNRTLTLREAKTQKIKSIRLNKSAIQAIMDRRRHHPEDVWLFQVHSNRANDAPISRISVSRVFKEVGDSLKLNIGTHTMRKSRGKAMYDDGVPIEKIALVLNHSSTAETLRYIGITKEQTLQTFDDYEL